MNYDKISITISRECNILRYTLGRYHYYVNSDLEFGDEGGFKHNLHPLDLPECLRPDTHAYIKTKRVIIKPNTYRGTEVYELKKDKWVKL